MGLRAASCVNGAGAGARGIFSYQSPVNFFYHDPIDPDLKKIAILIAVKNFLSVFV